MGPGRISDVKMFSETIMVELPEVTECKSELFKRCLSVKDVDLSLALFRQCGVSGLARIGHASVSLELSSYLVESVPGLEL